MERFGHDIWGSARIPRFQPPITGRNTMTLLPRIRGPRHALVGATLMAVLLSMGVQAGQAQHPPATQGNIQAWHGKMAGLPQPSQRGCFTAAYPKLEWVKVACVAAPSAPMLPRGAEPTPQDIGGQA